MDVQYEQLHTYSNALSYKRWLFIISLALLIHVFILFTLNSLLKFREEKSYRIIPLISVILESAGEIIVQSENESEPTETDTTVIRENPVKLENTELDKLNPPAWTHKIPERTLTPENESNSKNIQFNSRDLITLSKEYLDREAEEEFLRDEMNKKMWLKSPSIVYGKPPEYFMHQEEIFLPDEQDNLAMYLNTAMLNKENEPLIKPLKFTIGPVTCYTLLISIGCAW